MARPALSDDQVHDRVHAYCERYGVSAGPEGLPPFPSGRRESLQHREWLTVYRALQRLKARSSAGLPSETSAEGSCAVCARALSPDDAVAFPRGRRSRPEKLHATCAELARLAEKAGPEAVSRLSRWLWPRRARPASP